MSGTNDAKRELRRRMRAVRRTTAAIPGRSAQVAARLATLPELASARAVMLFTALAGEPDLGPLVEALRERGVTVATPAQDPAAPWPIAPGLVDVVVVPGMAFARDGHRLGQGGGWYDRFLAGVRPDCAVVGVCFDEQLVDEVPAEPHDVPVGMIVTPTRTIVAAADHSG